MLTMLRIWKILQCNDLFNFSIVNAEINPLGGIQIEPLLLNSGRA